MAITRSQIAKQLLSNGGRIGFDEGTDAKAARSRDKYSGSKAKSSGATKEGRDVPTGRELAISRQFTPENLEITLGKGPDRRTYADKRDELALKQLELMGVPRSNLPGLMGIGLNVASQLRNIILKKNIDRYKKNRYRSTYFIRIQTIYARHER